MNYLGKEMKKFRVKQKNIKWDDVHCRMYCRISENM